MKIERTNEDLKEDARKDRDFWESERRRNFFENQALSLWAENLGRLEGYEEETLLK